MAWWAGDTSNRIVRGDDGNVQTILSFEDQFRLFASPEFKSMAGSPEAFAKLLSRIPEKLSKPLIVAACKALGASFSDPVFPAGLSSLYNDQDDIDPEMKSTFGRLKWKRFEEMYQGNKRVFDTVEPGDIKQGILGDCYFLSSLSALAEVPKRIERIFETAEYDPTGCYKLRMYDMGQLTEIIVDDLFPVQLGGELAFSGPKVEKGVAELWVILLEKAWAKKFGSYQRIDAGFTNEALSDLTGAPCDVLTLEATQEVWQKIITADKENFVITASSKASTKGDTINEVGLVSQHAYAVIAAKEVSTKTGPERLLMIRNPWGEQEWTGDWSDNSSKWTPELKKTLDWSNSDDGRFWMNFNDFCKFYDEVVICHVHDDFQITSLKMNQQPGAFSVVQVTVTAAGRFYVIGNQVDSKRFPQAEYQCSPVRLVVAKVGANQQLQFVKGKLMDLRDSWVDVEGTPGDYLVFIQVDWATDLTQDFGLSVYSPQEVHLAVVTQKNLDFLRRVYTKEFALSLTSGVQKVTEARDLTRFTISRVGLDDDGNTQEGFITDIYVNTASGQRAEVSATHPLFQNVELMSPQKGKDYKVTVHAKDTVSVVKRVINAQELPEYHFGVTIRLVKT